MSVKLAAVIALCMQLVLPGSVWAACGVAVSPIGLAGSVAIGCGERGGQATPVGFACCALCELADCCNMGGRDDRDPLPEPRTPPDAPTRLPMSLLRGLQPLAYEAWDGVPGPSDRPSAVAASRGEIDVRWGEFKAAGRCSIACVWVT